MGPPKRKSRSGFEIWRSSNLSNIHGLLTVTLPLSKSSTNAPAARLAPGAKSTSKIGVPKFMPNSSTLKTSTSRMGVSTSLTGKPNEAVKLFWFGFSHWKLNPTPPRLTPTPVARRTWGLPSLACSASLFMVLNTIASFSNCMKLGFKTWSSAVLLGQLPPPVVWLLRGIRPAAPA